MVSDNIKNKFFFIISLLIFLVGYSTYVFLFNFKVDDYSDIIIASTFFFTLFLGFFITRQNDRYTGIVDEISNTDGLFSLLYRVAGVVPSVQKKVRVALRDHYQKILDSNNWAYHILNPSTTITGLFNAFAIETSKEDKEKLEITFEAIFKTITELQISRKRMVMLYDEELLPLQWAIVLILGVLVVISFNFIPNHTLGINILKVIFGIAVVFVILLLKQLDELSIFGKDFNKRTADDILRIIDEKDAVELKKIN
jgi:hypothetical protein